MGMAAAATAASSEVAAMVVGLEAAARGAALAEVADEIGFRAPEGDYETIGGLVLHVLGHIPDDGESVELTGFDADAAPDGQPRWRATVARMDGRRIDLLDMVRLTETDGTESNSSEERA